MIERPAAARDAGFDGVEMLFPYAMPPETLRDALAEAGTPLALFNTPVPDWDEGGRGCAAIPGRETEFRKGFEHALRYAETLRPARIHIMSGLAKGRQARATYEQNLRWAAEIAPEQKLTIEPINARDMPGYFLNDFDLAADILDTVGAVSLGLQFDAYHAHRTGGDVMGCWQRHGARAVHVQIAAAERRHEPGPGAIDYPALFARLDADGYDGWISAEYMPKGNTQDGLGWLQATRV